MGTCFVQFKCHHALHCCTDVICLPTPWDVVRIVKATGLSPRVFLDFLTPDDITEVEKNDPTWLKCNGRRYLMAIKRCPGPRCFFLDRNRRICTIYEARPILCRLYPFKLHTTRSGAFRAFSLHKDVECPRHRDGKIPVQPLYDLYLEDRKHQEDYVEMVRVFNRKRTPGRRPEDFIDMFYAEHRPGLSG